MGCHAVSADGSTLVARSRPGPNDGSNDNRAWVSSTSRRHPAQGLDLVRRLRSRSRRDGKYTVSGSQTIAPRHTTTGATIMGSGSKG